jgi:membrane-associated protease RseP (regulator of RpoE activity)
MGLPFGVHVMLLVFAAAWLALLAHELGHALMARLLGIRVWSISLGHGPTLWRGTVGRTLVRIAPLPLRGEVRLHDLDAESLGYHDAVGGGGRFEWRTGSSWRAPIISAGGSLANFLAARAVIAYWASGPRPQLSMFMWTMALFLVNFFMLLNLMPLRGFDGRRIAVHAAAWRQRIPVSLAG